MWREATTGKVGSNQHSEGSDNVTTLKPERGTSLSYTLDRLKRSAPEQLPKFRPFEFNDEGTSNMTTQVTLSNTSYTDLGVGPILLAAVGGPIAYQVNATLPLVTSAGYPLNPEDGPVNIHTATHVWALQVNGLSGFTGSALVSTTSE
jgi:hypothetical protein